MEMFQEKLADLKAMRSKFSILQTAGSYLNTETTIDTKRETETLKKTLDEQIRSLESKTSGFKKAVDAQKSLQSELIESQAVLDNLNNYLEAQRAATKEGSKVKPCFDELVPQLQVSFKS